jgi:hypothetical protein
MKRIIFNDPSKDLMKQLKSIGLVNFYDANDSSTNHLKGKRLYDLKLEGISEKAIWGDYTDIKIKDEKYIEKYFNVNANSWKSATIDLSDKGIEILKQSGLKGWEIKN